MGTIKFFNDIAIESIIGSVWKIAKINNLSDIAICYIRYNNGQIESKLLTHSNDSTAYLTWENTDDNIMSKIRSVCGGRMLAIYGVPYHRPPPTVYLIPDISLILKFGILGYLKAIRSWRGSSVVGKMNAVTYKTIWDILCRQNYTPGMLQENQ